LYYQNLCELFFALVLATRLGGQFCGGVPDELIHAAEFYIGKKGGGGKPRELEGVK